MIKSGISLVVLAMALAVTSTTFSQSWEMVGNGLPNLGTLGALHVDSVNDRLLISGRFNNTDSLTQDRLYQYDGTLTRLEYNTYENASTRADFIFDYQNKVLLTGNFARMQGVFSPGIVEWDGQQAVPWPPAVAALDSGVFVTKATVIGDSIIFGYLGDSVNGELSRGVMLYDGTTLKGLAGGLMASGSQVRTSDVAYFMGQIYTCGNWNIGADSWDFAVLTDGLWQKPEGWVIDPFGNVAALQVYKNKLYLGGEFSKANGSLGNNLLAYDGIDFHEIGIGLNFKVIRFRVIDDLLLILGVYQNANGLPVENITIWDGENLCRIDDSDFGLNGIHDAAIFHDSLFILGGFRTINGDTFGEIAKRLWPIVPDSCSYVGNVGIEAIQEQDVEFSLYPNPATNTVTLDIPIASSDEIKVSIIGIHGRPIRVLTNYEEGQEIDISMLIPGMYLVHIRLDEWSGVQRLIVFD